MGGWVVVVVVVVIMMMISTMEHDGDDFQEEIASTPIGAR